MAFGSDAQKKQHLPPILSSEVWWCQGYSEPGSGSDLASLQMRCEDKGDHYLLNGSKIWTTHAQWADWMFNLVRTKQGAQAAGRHQLPARRHEDAGHQGRSDRHDGLSRCRASRRSTRSSTTM